MQDFDLLNERCQEYEVLNLKMKEKIEAMKRQEIARIQHLDLDDIDLVTPGSHRRNEKNASKPNPLIPKLDLTKIFELRDQQNHAEHEQVIRQHIKHELEEEIELSIRDDFLDGHLNPEEYVGN